MEKILPIGEYIEKGINSLEQNLSFLWGGIDDGISWTVENLNDLFLSIPFVVIIVLVAVVAYYANAKGKLFTKE
jgi:glycine betaine/proline transport system permease protein